MTHIRHVTLTTGHSRKSSRAELHAGIVEQLAPLVAEIERHGSADFPSPTGLMQIIRLAPDRPSRHIAAWAISDPQGPTLITLAVAMRDRPGAGLWRTLHASPMRPNLATSADDPPPAPWLGVILHLDAMIPTPHPALGWLGDFERCLAWTWVDTVWSQDNAG